MNPLRTKRILLTIAKHYQHERVTFSKHEISAKLQEIKTLAAQKSIPKAKIQAEIFNLEEKLESIYSVEQKILKEKKVESTQERSLKRQILALQQKLELTKDKNIQLKIEKISSLLAEYLAKHHIHKDVAHEKVIHKVKKQRLQRKKQLRVTKKLKRHKLNQSNKCFLPDSHSYNKDSNTRIAN